MPAPSIDFPPWQRESLIFVFQVCIQGWNYTNKTNTKAKIKSKGQEPRRANKPIYFHLKQTGDSHCAENSFFAIRHLIAKTCIVNCYIPSRQKCIDSNSKCLNIMLFFFFRLHETFIMKPPKTRWNVWFRLETMSNSVVLLRFVLKLVQTR